MKEAENAIDTRSQDLQQAIARLHDTVKYAKIDRPTCILFLEPVAIDDTADPFPGSYVSFHRADLR